MRSQQLQLLASSNFWDFVLSIGHSRVPWIFGTQEWSLQVTSEVEAMPVSGDRKNENQNVENRVGTGKPRHVWKMAIKRRKMAYLDTFVLFPFLQKCCKISGHFKSCFRETSCYGFWLLFALKCDTALVWQLMRAYTLSLLNKLKVLDQSSKSTDQQIVSWANNKVR